MYLYRCTLSSATPTRNRGPEWRPGALHASHVRCSTSSTQNARLYSRHAPTCSGTGTRRSRRQEHLIASDIILGRKGEERAGQGQHLSVKRTITESSPVRSASSSSKIPEVKLRTDLQVSRHTQDFQGAGVHESCHISWLRRQSSHRQNRARAWQAFTIM